MQHFVIKLRASREGFMHSMTPEEMGVMQTHAAYWAGLLEQGTAIVYGPVDDPAGSYGIGVVAVAGEAALETIRLADPAISAGIGLRYEIAPMLRAFYKQ